MQTVTSLTINNYKEIIDKASRVLITAHLSPDGDAIGACLAFQSALTKLGKTARVVFRDPIPSAYQFLPGADGVVTDAGQELAGDLLIILDVGDLDRTDMDLKRPQLQQVPMINVDHHVTNTAFGTVNIVDPSSVATSELVFDLILELGVEIDRDIATCLLTGIVADTQGFRVPATTARTMRIAADLMEQGAPLGEISDQVFKTKPASSLKLWGLSLGNIQRRGEIVYAELLPWMLSESGAGIEESEGLVNLLSSVRDAQVAILFKQVEDQMTRISVRTGNTVNAASICGYFGGGGHARAAGCSLGLPLVEAEAVFLAHVEEVLREG